MVLFYLNPTRKRPNNGDFFTKRVKSNEVISDGNMISKLLETHLQKEKKRKKEERSDEMESGACRPLTAPPRTTVVDIRYKHQRKKKKMIGRPTVSVLRSHLILLVKG